MKRKFDIAARRPAFLADYDVPIECTLRFADGRMPPAPDSEGPREKSRMITAIATFRLPHRLTVDDAKAIFLSTAPRYQSQPGLIRKYYVLSEDGMTAGGVYLWQSRQAADALYNDAWRAFVTEKYGAPPQVMYMESPVIVDNTTRQILSE